MARPDLGVAQAFLPARGEEAIAALKKQGSYEGLQQALQAARYRIKPVATENGPYRALNPAQRIQAEFAPEQTRLIHQGQLLTVRLTGYGYGERLAKPAPAEVVAEGNRVQYRRGPLVEWYVNDPAGLEQGFTLSAAPAGGPLPNLSFRGPTLFVGPRNLFVQGAVEEKQVPRCARNDKGVVPNDKGPLVVAMRFDGSLRPVLDRREQAVVLHADSGPALRYGELKAWDSTGRLLPARLDVRQSEVRIEVDDRDAIYPLTVDPLFTLQRTLTASDGAADDHFGWAVAVSGDTAVVGAFRDDTFAGTDAGSAYVFVRSGGVLLWTQQAKLTASDGAAFDQFGVSVAVSGDTVVVGANKADTPAGVNTGSAYVFVRSAGVWSQQQKLTASDAVANGEFGWAVALAGETAVVGAPQGIVPPFGAGSAYVFVRSGGVWSQQQKLTASDGAQGDLFGNAVSVSGDTAVVGGFRNDTAAGTDAGAVYVFTRSGGVWSQQQKVTAPDGAESDQFGYSLAVSGDTLVVGVPEDDNASGVDAGAAYVFVRNAGVWSQQQKLTASGGAAVDYFGFSVAVSGNTAVVGAQAHDWYGNVELDECPGGTDAGAAYVFVRSADVWSQQQELTACSEANDQLGLSVAVSGRTVVVGAWLAGSVDAGKAYVYEARFRSQVIIFGRSRPMAPPLASKGF